MFWKVLFMWSSMQIFSFIGYTLTELFRKTDNWRKIYKQTSSTFYTSNDVSRRKNYLNVITKLRNSWLISFLKKHRSSHRRSRSSHRRCSIKKGILKNFVNLTGKHLYWSLFLIKLQALSLQVFFKKRLQHKCLPVKFAKFLRALIFEEHLQTNASGGV